MAGMLCLKARASAGPHLAALLMGAIALLLALAAPQPAFAQSTPPPPLRTAIDENGVDLMRGTFNFSSPTLSIGQPGQGGLSYTRRYEMGAAGGERDNLQGTINWSWIGTSQERLTLTLFGESVTFVITLATGAIVPEDLSHGATLTFNSVANTYAYTMRDGSVAVFDRNLSSEQPTKATRGRVVSVTRPNGEVTTFTYTTLSASGFWRTACNR